MLLSKYIGQNEKTRIVVQLGRDSRFAPPSPTNPVDEDTRKKMLAYYYRRQEEQKLLSEDNEDSYLNSI